MSDALTFDQIVISDDMTLADVVTLEDCEVATLTLARDINRIEEQLADVNTLARVHGGAAWTERAESALRFKKAIRNTVHNIACGIRRDERAAAMRTRDRAIVDALAGYDVFDDVVAAAKHEHPELWSK